MLDYIVMQIRKTDREKGYWIRSDEGLTRDTSAFRISVRWPIYIFNSVDKYGLLTKREVKMTGYWPSSFFACLWTETKSRSINTQKKNEANIQSS